ncbi:hypothetical protein JCM15415_18710 [Methanobacterium movens]
MRKIATIFMLMVTLSVVFAGAVSAQDVNVVVIDENDELVEEACVGDEVTVAVLAENTGNETIDNALVTLQEDPENSLRWWSEDYIDVLDAVAFFNGVRYENTAANPFYFYDLDLDAYVFWIGWNGPMFPGDVAELYVPAWVMSTGEITVNAILWDWEGYPFEPNPEGPIFLDEDSYTFMGVACPVPIDAATVPMQKTGTPLALALVGLLGIIGGTIYGKFR